MEETCHLLHATCSPIFYLYNYENSEWEQEVNDKEKKVNDKDNDNKDIKNRKVAPSLNLLHARVLLGILNILFH